MIPRGVQCYFGEEVSRRRKVEAILAAVMKNWGFEEIILPFFDYLEDFSYGLGSRLGDRAYRFLDSDGSVLALRPDLTTLVAKTAATRMADHSPPIKLFYSGEVFRQERMGVGKQKEFYQVGLESMGSAGAWADAEAILIAVDCLLHLGVKEFKTALGHAGFFNGIVAGMNLSPEKASALRDAIDHKDCVWLKKEVESLEIGKEKKEFLIELPNFVGGRDELDRALSIVQNPRSREALQTLMEIYAVLDAIGLSQYLTFDLGEVRDLDYYTGIVFKIYARAPGFELGGGGRYDDLLAKFGWNLPAVGFSFTLDSLLPLVGNSSFLEVPDIPADTLTLNVSGVPLERVFPEAWQLRRRNCRVRLCEGA